MRTLLIIACLLPSLALAQFRPPSMGWTDGAAGVWTFDEGGARDWSGNGNNGTAVAGAANVQEQGRRSYTFNGSTSLDALDCGAASATHIVSNSFTVSAWVYVYADTGSVIRRAVSKSVTNYELVFREANNTFGFYCGNEVIARATGTDATGVWTHLVGVYDHPNTDAHLYKDGVLLASDTTATPPDGAASNFFIGNYPSLPRAFYGLVDDVRVYARAFSAAEVRQLYEEGR
jgi:hypothetical protein